MANTNIKSKAAKRGAAKSKVKKSGLGNIPTSRLSTNKKKPKSVKTYGGVPMRKLKK